MACLAVVGDTDTQIGTAEKGGRVWEKEKEVKPGSSAQPAWRAKGTSRTEKHGLMSFCDSYSCYCRTFNTEELSFKVRETDSSNLVSSRKQRECENVGGTAEGWFDKYSSALVMLKGHNIYPKSDLFYLGFQSSIYLHKDLSFDSNRKKHQLFWLFWPVIGFVRFPVLMLQSSYSFIQLLFSAVYGN